MTRQELDRFLYELYRVLPGWSVAARDIGDAYIIKARRGQPLTTIRSDEVPVGLGELVWIFDDDGRTAWLKLKKPLDFIKLAAMLVGGELMEGAG